MLIARELISNALPPKPFQVYTLSWILELNFEAIGKY
jgi:hypothetical protein